MPRRLATLSRRLMGRPSDTSRNFLQKPGQSRFLGGLGVQMIKVALLGGALAVALAPAAVAQDYKMTTPIAPGVATPNHLDTSIGPVDLIDGSPTAATVEKIYDNLDGSRALQAYLLATAIVNQAGARDTPRKSGPDNQTCKPDDIEPI
jgi:hypothetical protein